MKRCIIFLLTCMMLLTACGGERVYNGEEIELWLVTEESQAVGMNQQVEMIIEQFKALYPNVTVRLDILPTSEESRTGYLKKIRSEIMAGKGPDVYLLPTAPQSPPGEEIFSTLYMEPLFGSVPQHMYNGIFTDISEYYDADEDLHTESLVTAVMDAGVMNGARYILPLRYQYDVLAVDMDAFEDPSVFEGGITGLYDLALELNDYRAAHAVNIRPSISLVSEFVDYEAGNVLMDAQELAELMESYREVFVLADEENHQDVGHYFGSEWVVIEPAYPGYTCSIESYIYTFKTSERIFTTSGYSFMRLDLADVADAAASVKAQEQNIAMYPIRAADGSLVAEITYYGAVGAGCKHPEIAYEFLRMFMSEEMQWEQYYPRNNMDGMVEEGFPVRTGGFVDQFWEIKRARLQAAQNADIEAKENKYIRRRGKFLKESFTFTDEDVPVLSAQIDEARFPVTTVDGDFFRQYINQLIDNGDPLELAEAMIDDLQWYIAEG